MINSELLQLKLDILKTTLDTLISYPNDYGWLDPAFCNCGILAQSCDISINEIYDSNIGYWSEDLKLCKTTNRSIKDIIHTLKEHGFTAKEMRDFELLSNNKYTLDVVKFTKDDMLLQKENENTFRYENTIKYLTNWINDLKSVA